MIRPTKHAKARLTTLPVAAALLKHLKRHRSETFLRLKEVVNRHDEAADSLFLPAVQLLFLFGLVEYHQQNDTFEYVGGKS